MTTRYVRWRSAISRTDRCGRTTVVTAALAVVVAIAQAVATPGVATALGGNPQSSSVLYIVKVNDGCSGTVIAPSKVATAKHCHNDNGDTVNGVTATGWTAIDGRDVGVITVPTPQTQPTVPLAQTRPPIGTIGTIIGYGITEDGGFGTSRQGNLTVTGYDDSDMLWADGNVRACRGDSGGALIVDGHLTGITSLGDPYCQGQYHDTSFVPVADIYAQITAADLTEQNTIPAEQDN